MNKIFRLLIVVAAFAMLFCACKKEDAALYFATESSETLAGVVTPTGEGTSSNSSNENATDGADSASSLDQDLTNGGTSGDTSSMYCIYICGQVAVPGVYYMQPGARVCDAIEKAGGLCDGASESFWNQAELIYDGQMIYVPTETEAAEGAVSAGQTSTISNESSQVNINTADKDELMTLSGIGESKADSIIKYRTQNGSFNSIEDIKNVSGIGDAMFEKIKDDITVN